MMDKETRLTRFCEDTFTHLPYGILQSIGHETDGGLAAINEMDARHPYDSVFMGNGGEKLLEIIQKAVGIDEMIDRLQNVPLGCGSLKPSWRLPARAHLSDFRKAGEVFADALINNLHEIYPEVSKTSLDETKPALVDFGSEYCKSVQHHYCFASPYDQSIADEMGLSDTAACFRSSDDITTACAGPLNRLKPGVWIVVTDSRTNGRKVEPFETMDEAYVSFDKARILSMPPSPPSNGM